MANDDRQTFHILMAEDDQDHLELAREAFKAAKLINELHIVEDGQKLIDYLSRAKGYNEKNAPRPGLILLDLDMPGKTVEKLSPRSRLTPSYAPFRS